MATNGTESGTLFGDDEDWYAFDVFAGQAIDVGLTATTENEENIKFSMYDPDSNPIGESPPDDSETDEDESTEDESTEPSPDSDDSKQTETNDETGSNESSNESNQTDGVEDDTSDDIATNTEDVDRSECDEERPSDASDCEEMMLQSSSPSAKKRTSNKPPPLRLIIFLIELEAKASKTILLCGKSLSRTTLRRKVPATIAAGLNRSTSSAPVLWTT